MWWLNQVKNSHNEFFVCAISSENLAPFPALIIPCVHIWVENMPPPFISLCFFFLFNFSGFSALHLTLSSMWALFRCSFVFISDRSLSNKTFQIVSEQHSWVLCAQHSGSSQFDSVQITQTQLIQSNKSKSQCKSQLNSRIQYVKCNERPKTTRPVECVKEELLGGSKSTAIAA